jgi:beta-phosphoglucomutase-like phosphatase (HAD superfamily)
VLGLPADVGACLFHGDGVLTHTPQVHAADRKRMFDDYPRRRAARTGGRFVPARRGRRFLRRPGPRHLLDGIVPEREHLDGRPALDAFLEGASALGVERREAAVVEDALAGVAAGRARRFGSVRVYRAGQADALRSHGGDVVVSDVAELLERP